MEGSGKTSQHWKVGQLAQRLGVSVRTLHHYDEIGLLRPALGGRGQARLYGQAEFERLQRIGALRSIGLSLEEIRSCLDDPRVSAHGLLDRHLARVEERIEAAQGLRDHLRSVRAALGDPGSVGDGGSSEDLLRAIDATERTGTFARHYSQEQLEELAQRAEGLGPDGLESARLDWQGLIESFRQALASRLPADHPEVLELARDRAALIEGFTGGDAGIRQSLGELHRAQPRVRERFGLDPELWDYMARAGQALEAHGDPPPAP